MIITQSKYVTSPKKLLKKKPDTETLNLIHTYWSVLYWTFLSFPVRGSLSRASYLAYTMSWQNFRNLLSRGTAKRGVSKNGWFSLKSSSRWFLVKTTKCLWTVVHLIRIVKGIQLNSIIPAIVLISIFTSIFHEKSFQLFTAPQKKWCLESADQTITPKTIWTEASRAPNNHMALN